MSETIDKSQVNNGTIKRDKRLFRRSTYLVTKSSWLQWMWRVLSRGLLRSTLFGEVLNTARRELRWRISRIFLSPWKEGHLRVRHSFQIRFSYIYPAALFSPKELREDTFADLLAKVTVGDTPFITGTRGPEATTKRTPSRRVQGLLSSRVSRLLAQICIAVPASRDGRAKCWIMQSRGHTV